MKFKKSIKYSILMPLILSFLLTTILIVHTSLKDSIETNEIMLYNQSTVTSNIIKDELKNSLEEAIKLVNVNFDMFRNSIFFIDDSESREIYFSKIISNFDQVAMSYIGFEDGSFYGSRRNIDASISVVKNDFTTNNNSEYYSIDRQGKATVLTDVFENFDPRNRPWYINAKENNSISFSDIYSHFVFLEPTLTVSLPIYEDNILIGVIGVDFLMTSIGNKLASMPIGENGDIYIVDNNNNIIASTLNEPIFKTVEGKSVLKNIEEYDDELIKETYKLFNIEDNSNELNGYLLNISNFEYENINWKIVTILKKEDFLGDISSTVTKAILFVLVIIGLFIFSAFIITNRFVSHIKEITDSVHDLTKGIFRKIRTDNKKAELKILSDGFNEMGERITLNLEHLEKEVQLRTEDLQNKNDILLNLSYFDGLMRIANRRKFDEFVESSIDLSKRAKLNLAILMIDIDDFKIYNDTYGHLAGDDCLRDLGKLLNEIITRKTDLVARYGGEEIVVVLNDTNLEGALKIANDIREKCNILKKENKYSSHKYVTLSIGIGVYNPVDNIDALELISKSDKALYKAKRMGKNRVEVFDVDL